MKKKNFDQSESTILFMVPTEAVASRASRHDFENTFYSKLACLTILYGPYFMFLIYVSFLFLVLNLELGYISIGNLQISFRKLDIYGFYVAYDGIWDVINDRQSHF